jgi:integrase
MPDRYRLAAILGAGCGLRVGEVLGLRVRSVRIEEAELAVVEQLQLLPGRPPVLRPPKTASSIRVVPLPQLVADAIVLHLEHWPAEDDELVLRSRNGSYLWPNTFNDSSKTSSHVMTRSRPGIVEARQFSSDTCTTRHAWRLFIAPAVHAWFAAVTTVSAIDAVRLPIAPRRAFVRSFPVKVTGVASPT